MTSTSWNYPEGAWSEGDDVVGYDVETTDGTIGTVDEATSETDRSWLVVDTGVWIFGKKRLIPAGTVNGVDHERKTVMVGLSKDEIKSAPDYDKDDWNDDSRGRHTDYYTPYSGR